MSCCARKPIKIVSYPQKLIIRKGSQVITKEANAVYIRLKEEEKISIWIQTGCYWKKSHILCGIKVLRSREKAFCSVGSKKRQKAIRLSEPVAKAKPGLADVIYVNVWTPSFWYLIWTWLPIKSKQFLQTNGKGWQLLCNVWRMLLGFSTLPSNFKMEFPINRVELLLLLIAEIGAEDIQKRSFVY